MFAPLTIMLGTGEALRIKSAAPEDAQALSDYARHILGDSSYQIAQLHEFDVSADAQRKRIKEYSDAEGKLFLCAEVGDRLVGILDFANHPRERKRHVGAFGISVHADWRRKGIGRVLIETLLEWAAAHRDIEKVTLAVFSTNAPAMRLYESLGFAEEGRRPKEIKMGSGKYVDDVLMYRFVK